MTRVRWPDELDPQLRRWLTRVQRTLAHVRSTLLIYSEKRNVGGDSLIGNKDYARRAARADRTILYDALTLVLDECNDIREQVQAVMDSTTPTHATPGSPQKVAVMEARARDGFSIFADGDAR